MFYYDQFVSISRHRLKNKENIEQGIASLISNTNTIYLELNIQALHTNTYNMAKIRHCSQMIKIMESENKMIKVKPEKKIDVFISPSIYLN
jgi:hypothetical protein